MMGLYSNGMHDYILDEIELGERAAMCMDDEACGFGAIFDLDYEEYMKNHG